MKLYDLWLEGFETQESCSDAKHLGKYKAKNITEAVKMWNFEHPLRTVDYNRFGKNRHAIWGCEIFDNEKKAKKLIEVNKA